MVPASSVAPVVAGWQDRPYAPGPMSAATSLATPVRLALVTAALALLAMLLVRPLADPTGALAMGKLPACRYDDVLTTPRGYADWAVTLVDTILRVPKGYAPPDLVGTGQAGIRGGGEIRAVAIEDLREMASAAAAAGNAIAVQSGYRSYASQQAVFQGWVDRLGYDRALEVSARPGHSEHQLGLGIDFRADPGGSPFTGRFETTPQAAWLKANAWEYGWVMSYPKGRIAVTCYDFEPWHYRYVGREIAAQIQSSGLTPRQYLWANFTTTVVPPAPQRTQAPSRSARPTAAPSASLLPSTTPVPTPRPTIAPTRSPAASVGPSAPSTALPSPSGPGGTAGPSVPPAPADGQPVALVAAGGALVVVAAGVLGLLAARRRGQSGVGL